MDTPNLDQPRKLETVDDVFDAFGGPTRVARALGLKRADGSLASSTASEMKRRGNIPVDYWPRLIEAAPEYDVSGLTPETLMAIHVKPERAA